MRMLRDVGSAYVWLRCRLKIDRIVLFWQIAAAVEAGVGGRHPRTAFDLNRRRRRLLTWPLKHLSSTMASSKPTSHGPSRAVSLYNVLLLYFGLSAQSGSIEAKRRLKASNGVSCHAIKSLLTDFLVFSKETTFSLCTAMVGCCMLFPWHLLILL